jgi:methylated-DNA-protein-cysteine methyltransferase-like protein
VNNDEKIWQVVYGIPMGKVATYGQVATLAGLPGYARYVGSVLRKLPANSRLPWHRVINAGGRISFPAHSEQYRLQRSLLEAEGIVFINDRLSLQRFRL